MTADENSIFDEINEELKHDAVLSFLKKHQNATLWVIILLIAGIVGHSAWYSNKKKRLELATTSLHDELYRSAMKNAANDKKTKATLENLQKNAPSELVPLISLIKMGRELGTTEDVVKNAKQLLDLSEKEGIDIVWKDLALLTYVSYKLESEDKLLARLEQLTGEDHPFRFSAMEKIAMIYERRKDHDKAIEILTKITEDKVAPNTMKKRIAKVINYIKNHKDDPKGMDVQDQKKDLEEKGKSAAVSTSKKTVKALKKTGNKKKRGNRR